jgi:hypothetical protein
VHFTSIKTVFLFTAIPLDQYTCDFEDRETCIFVDSTQDDFDWTRRIVSLLLKFLNTVKPSKRAPPTMGKQLINFITCGCDSSAPFYVIYKAGSEPTPYW